MWVTIAHLFQGEISRAIKNLLSVPFQYHLKGKKARQFLCLLAK
jgi:hypothetical protein